MKIAIGGNDWSSHWINIIPFMGCHRQFLMTTSSSLDCWSSFLVQCHDLSVVENLTLYFSNFHSSSIIFNLGLSYPSVAIPVQFLAYACLESLSTFAYWVENVNWAPWRVKMLKFRELALRRSDWRNCGLCGGFIYCFISYTLWSVYIFSIRFYLHFLLYWKGEFVQQWRVSLVGGHSFYPRDSHSHEVNGL